MKLKIKEIALFSILGCLIFVSKLLMQLLPNIHIVGTLIVSFTLAYRVKALWPILTFLLIDGFYAFVSGSLIWWAPYIYIWLILWGAAMLVPKKTPKKIQPIIYMVVCALHGFLFGTMYAPAQALLFGLDFNGMIAWIITGFPYDIIHGISNFCFGTLIIPIATILKKADTF